MIIKMSCKDCLHYAAHKAFFEKTNGEDTFDRFFADASNHCEHFKDRSARMHLPCTEGDTEAEIKRLNEELIRALSELSLTRTALYDVKIEAYKGIAAIIKEELADFVPNVSEMKTIVDNCVEEMGACECGQALDWSDNK